MRKSKLLEGIYGVYVVYDKISKHYKDIYFASTDEDFIRLYLPTIVTTTALRELNIFKIGIFNDVTGELKSTTKKRINKVFIRAIGIDAICYCIIGISGYLTQPLQTPDLIIERKSIF